VLDAVWRYYTSGLNHDMALSFWREQGVDVSLCEKIVGRPIVGHTPPALSRQDRTIAHLASLGFMIDEMLAAQVAHNSYDDDGMYDALNDRAVLRLSDIAGTAGFIAISDQDGKRVNMAYWVDTHNSARGLYWPVGLPRKGDIVVVTKFAEDALVVAVAAAALGQFRGIGGPSVVPVSRHNLRLYWPWFAAQMSYVKPSELVFLAHDHELDARAFYHDEACRGPRLILGDHACQSRTVVVDNTSLITVMAVRGPGVILDMVHAEAGYF
jgi:hypothetical protein